MKGIHWGWGVKGGAMAQRTRTHTDTLATAQAFFQSGLVARALDRKEGKPPLSIILPVFSSLV